MEACPFCGSTERREHGGRPLAGCAGCGSLERHRALVHGLGAALEPRESGRALEVAPRSPLVFGGYLSAHGWRVEGADRWDLRGASDPAAFRTFIHHDADATDLAFAPSGAYELYMAQHVFAQVMDYPAALDEASRVLEPGGRAILEVPWNRALARTRLHPRNRHGNLWAFGNDIVGRLGARFAQVDYVTMSEGDYTSGVFLCRK